MRVNNLEGINTRGRRQSSAEPELSTSFLSCPVPDSSILDLQVLDAQVWGLLDVDTHQEQGGEVKFFKFKEEDRQIAERVQSWWGEGEEGEGDRTARTN